MKLKGKHFKENTKKSYHQKLYGNIYFPETYSGKSENCHYVLLLKSFIFIFLEMFIDKSSVIYTSFVLIVHFKWLLGPHQG